jgi:lipooligosaccharide transport system permease protein
VISLGFARVVERDVLAYRRMWVIFLTGFAEPVLYLFSIGVGLGVLVGGMTVAGHHTTYQAFVAPGLLATAAMNGSIFDTTFNFFFKIKISGTFKAMLATPLATMDVAFGQLTWALSRGTTYAGFFLFLMWMRGLIDSPWAVLALPVVVLTGFAFGGVGMAATSFMRSFVDFDYVQLALMPLFLFSGVFFPLSRYPATLALLVRASPLYQAVALERSLMFGTVNAATPLHALYLLAMGFIGMRIASRRLQLLLQP